MHVELLIDKKEGASGLVIGHDLHWYFLLFRVLESELHLAENLGQRTVSFSGLDPFNQIGDIVLFNKEIRVQVAVLHNLRVQVSELVSHELDSSAHTARIHLLNHCDVVTGQVGRLVHILGCFLKELVSEVADLWIRDGEHQVQVRPVVKQGHCSQLLDRQLFVLDDTVFTLFLQKLEVDVFHRRGQLDAKRIHGVGSVDDGRSESSLHVAHPLFEEVLSLLHGS